MFINRILKYFISALVSVCITIGCFAFSTKPLRLSSPDKKLWYEFEIHDGNPGYSVSYKNRKLIGFSILNLVFRNDSLIQGVRLEKSLRSDSAERYTLMTGRSSAVNDSFRQLTIFLKELNDPGLSLI